MKRQFIVLSFIVAAVAVMTAFTISGCATRKTRKEEKQAGLIYASSSKVPSWITDIPEEKDYFYFVGTGGDSENFDSGKQAALSDAISQVVGVIGVTVTSSSTIEEKYFAEQYQATISAELFTEGRAKIQDAEVKEIYYEKHRKPDGGIIFRVWVLVKYNKNEIKEEQERLNAILALKYGEVKKLEEKASDLTQKQMLSDAVIAHLNASVSALRIEEGQVFFDRNMNRASELLVKVRMQKFGEEQVGYVGNALENPLRLKVYYLEGERDIPIPNIPVRFSYKIPKTNWTGYKYQVYNSVTDSTGFAGFEVDMVYEVSDTNTVEAKIDFGPFIKQLKSVPPELQDRIKTFKDIQQTKKAAFIFRSDTLAREIRTGIYFIQFDKDEELLPKPVTAPTVYETLYEKKFSIKVLDINPVTIYEKSDEEIRNKLISSAGKGVKRIVFGYVRILNYDIISGFHTARASASATLIDKETGEVLRTWQISRSATGNSKELAGINVLTEAGKSLGEIISNTMP